MIVGIDLGTTNSAIAYINAYGKPEIIHNREGGRTTPSVILFEGNETVIIGEEAKNNSVLDPFNTIDFIKSEMGNPQYKFISGDTAFSPEELSSLILKKLIEDAEEVLNTKIEKAVVTVPAYFNDAQRKATQDSGKLIGIDIVKIINEPTAAALAYGLLHNSDPQNILVYDLGGGTFDATIVKVNGKEVIVQATDGIRDLGGRDFDDKIIDYAIKVFNEKHGIDLMDIDYVKELQELRRRGEDLKKALSTRKESQLYISCKGIREAITISRDQFNEMIKPLYNRTEIIVQDVLHQANLSPKDIDKILLVGGSTRIPLISEGLKETFGITPSKEVNPDEVVALGAAIQGSILEDGIKEIKDSKVVIKDVSSHSIGVISIDSKSGHKINSIILNRNSPLPAKSRRSFYTIEDNQEAIKLQITEGELEEIDYITIIGEFEIKLPAKLKKDTQVDIEMILDENQIIHVFTSIPQISGFFEEVHIERESNLKSEELEKKKDIVSKIEID